MDTVQKLETRDPADILTIGFGTAVAMWGAGYALRLPGDLVPAWLILSVMLLLLLAGGGVAGRLSPRGWRGALCSGLVTGTLNLLVLGGLLSDAHERGLTRLAWAWAPASIVLSGLIGGSGGALATLLGWSTGRTGSINWASAFALVVAAGTVLLISLGGAVTGMGAGLAVPDWPNSYGYNMFLYPLSRMTGDIYFEHAHRLFGSLVGLTTLVFVLYVISVDRRSWVKLLAGTALAAVILQGLLGGLRVTGRLTLSTDPEHLAPNLALAVVHGVLAQLFLALIVVLAVVLSTPWRSGALYVAPAAGAPAAPVGRWAVAALLCQLVLGALLRHTGSKLALAAHITMAVGVVALVGWFSLHADSGHRAPALVRRLAQGVLIALGLQFFLGFGALAGLSLEQVGRTNPVQAALTTLHQTTGALLLALTVGLVVARLHPTAGRSQRRAFAVVAPAPREPAASP